MNWLPEREYLPVTAPLTNGSDSRDPVKLEAVVAQFDVENHPRYRAGNGKTYCSTFSWDVTRALACEVPYWWLHNELNINRMIAWLGLQGVDHGWTETDRDTAVACANLGRPVLVTHRNPVPESHGHVAVMLPGGYISQAGMTNYARAPLAHGFGALPVQFWSHP